MNVWKERGVHALSAYSHRMRGETSIKLKAKANSTVLQLILVTCWKFSGKTRDLGRPGTGLTWAGVKPLETKNRLKVIQTWGYTTKVRQQGHWKKKTLTRGFGPHVCTFVDWPPHRHIWVGYCRWRGPAFLTGRRCGQRCTQNTFYWGSLEENEFHVCVQVCGVEGRGKSLYGQFFFVCQKDEREESSMNHSGAWRGLKTKWDLKLSLPSPTYLIRYLFIKVGTTTPKLKLDAFQLWQLRSLNFQSFSDPSEIRWRVRGAREAPAPRDSLNFRRASLLSRNEFESGTFTMVLHATPSFTYLSGIYGVNFPFNWNKPKHEMQQGVSVGKEKKNRKKVFFEPTGGWRTSCNCRVYKQCTGSLPRFQLFQSTHTKWLTNHSENIFGQTHPSSVKQWNILWTETAVNTFSPNAKSDVRSRSASDKKVVPRFIQDKIRIGSLIYRPDRRPETGSSSWDHHEPGINRNGGWQLDLTQAYTIHTFTLLAHTIALCT